MDDAPKAPQSQFSGENTELGAELRQAIAAIVGGGSAAVRLDLLHERAEQRGTQAALAHAYAELLAEGLPSELSDSARLTLLLQAAFCCAEQPELEDATLRAAAFALDLKPTEERALALLEPRLLETEAYAELAARFTAAAQCAPTEARAKHLLEHALRLLSDVPAASAATLGLHASLNRLPELRKQDEALLGMLRSGDAAAERALVQLGERWLKDGRSREGVELLPTDLRAIQSEAALDVLERLYDQAEAVDAQRALLRRRLVLEKTPRGVARAWEKLGQFTAEHGRTSAAEAGDPRGADGEVAHAYLQAAEAYMEAGEPDEAERMYERLLDVPGERLRAATALVRLRAQSGSFGSVTEAFGAVLAAQDDAKAVAALLLSLVPDARRARAADEFAELAENVQWRLAGEEHDSSLGLTRATASLYAAQDRYDEAAELYRRLIADRATSEDLDGFHALIEAHPGSEWRRHQQRWLFEWQTHHTSDRPTVLLSWARFEEHDLGDPEAARQVLERAAELAPERPEVWENLLRLRLSDGDADGGLAAATELKRLGHDIDDSLLHLVLEHQPNARFAFDRVKLGLSAERRFGELLDRYDRAIAAAAGDDERAAWLNEAAIAARDVAEDRERALGYWEQHVSLVPHDARVDSALERLYEQLGDKPGLIRHLQRRLEHLKSDAPDAAAGATNGTGLLEQRLTDLTLEAGDLDAAWALIEPRAAQPEQAQELLERLFGRGIELFRASPSARSITLKAGELLRQRYAEAGQPQAVARLLERELEVEQDSERRQELLVELIRVCERELSDVSAAFGAARQLFILTASERDRKRLEKLAKKSGRFAELAKTYAAVARRSIEPAALRAFLAHAAEVTSHHLQDPAGATVLYGELLAFEPAQAIQRYEELEHERGESQEAFEALCALLDHEQRYAELAELLERTVAARATPALYGRLARLRYEHLGDPEGAIAAHIKAEDLPAAARVFLAQSSVFGETAEGALELSRGLSGLGSRDQAAHVLRHQIAVFGSHYSRARRTLTLELIAVLEAEGLAEAAEQELTEAARKYPADIEVQSAAALMAKRQQDWPRAEQCYRGLLLLLHGQQNEAGPHPAAIYAELGRIKQLRSEPEAADELFASGFEAALGDGVALAALAGALLEHGAWAHAERALLELCRAEPSARTAALILSGVTQLARNGRMPPDDLTAKAAALATRGVEHLEECADARERAQLLGACVNLLPLPEARKLLSRALGELSSAEAATHRLDLLRRELDGASGEARASAIAELEQLAQEPDAPTTTLELLARALEPLGDGQRLRKVLEAWLEREPKNTELWRRLLALSLEQSDTQAALSAYEKLAALGAAPSSELLLELGRACLQSEPKRAADLLCRVAEREPKAAKRCALLLEAAELLRGSGEVARAAEAAAEARQLDPTSAEAVLLSAQLTLDTGTPEQALTQLTAYIESKERRRGKALARVLRLAADLRLAQDELDVALPLLTEAHQLDKSDLDTALQLGLLAVDLDRLETAAGAFRTLIAQRELGTKQGVAARSATLAQGYFQLARIEQHHGKKTNAKRMAARALEENPEHAAAQSLLRELSVA